MVKTSGCDTTKEIEYPKDCLRNAWGQREEAGRGHHCYPGYLVMAMDNLILPRSYEM